MRFNILFLVILLLAISCEEIIEVEDISQEQVEVLAPINNAVVNTPQVRFSWEQLAFSENYRLQVATPNFLQATQIIEDTLISTLQFDKVLEAGDYEWRIKALNSAYQTPYKTQSFSVEE